MRASEFHRQEHEGFCSARRRGSRHDETVRLLPKRIASKAPPQSLTPAHSDFVAAVATLSFRDLCCESDALAMN